MRLFWIKLLPFGVLAMLGSSPALAQNVSNEAWLGQLGTNNILDIDQQGTANSAGADNVYLLLSQVGTGNSLALEQFGYSNKIGTLFGDEPGFARGVWQNGDLNTINVIQRNQGPGGSNIIGAVQQASQFNLTAGGANRLTVYQVDTDGLDGTAGHYIGRLVQVNTEGTGADNRAFIVQRGGGAGEGNILANLRQSGGGNLFGLIQAGQSNQIGENASVGGVWQTGTDNRAWIVQDGTANLIEYVEQFGIGNAARTRLSGERNAIASILQNDEGFGDDGNFVEITIAGQDNGGTGAGGVGEFLRLIALNQSGVIQGAFRQFGGDNSIRFTISGGTENKYGITQDGDGNQAFVSMASTGLGQFAERNETAIFQDGSVNYATQIVLGNDNAGAIVQVGRRNRVELSQTGEQNFAELRIYGDDNNSEGSELFGSALETSLSGLALLPGEVLQVGMLNAIEFETTGTFNGFTFEQSGDENTISGSMAGIGNALAVVQQNQKNTSASVQSGADNSLGVHQF